MASTPIALFRALTNGVYVIGTAAGERRNAFTAAWVTQVSFEPLLLVLSINPGHASYPQLVQARRFAVSILRDTQIALAEHFGTQSGYAIDKLSSQRWEPSPEGSPFLLDALGYLDCHVLAEHPAGDHVLILGQVVGGQILDPDAIPMAYRDTGNLDGSAALYPPSL